MKLRLLLATICSLGSHLLFAQTYDVKADWSETSNPNGVWSYTDNGTPLPHVAWWQRNLGGWTSAQPAWAYSEDSNNRLPMFYRSNGTETFGSDIQSGDIAIHTWDPTNGVGTGEGVLVWTAPHPSILHIEGNIWMTRDIGRANDWTLRVNDVTFTGGSLFTGDPYNRANPMNLAAGSGGALALQGILVDTGDRLSLNIVRAQGSVGDFAAFNLKIVEDAQVARSNPSSLVVRLGRVDAGSVGNLSSRDGNVLRICKFIVPNQVVPPINVEVTGASPTGSPTMIVFRTMARMQQTGVFQQTLDLFDFTANAFDPNDVSIAAITPTFSDQTVTATGNVARYVSPGNELRARYRIKQTGPAASLIWCSEHDKAVWLVR